jgi:hypothetical protein
MVPFPLVGIPKTLAAIYVMGASYLGLPPDRLWTPEELSAALERSHINWLERNLAVTQNAIRKLEARKDAAAFADVIKKFKGEVKQIEKELKKAKSGKPGSSDSPIPR